VSAGRLVRNPASHPTVLVGTVLCPDPPAAKGVAQRRRQTTERFRPLAFTELVEFGRENEGIVFALVREPLGEFTFQIAGEKLKRPSGAVTVGQQIASERRLLVHATALVSRRPGRQAARAAAGSQP
jgi:hypothetical protein